jgi:hypothetical protein
MKPQRSASTIAAHRVMFRGTARTTYKPSRAQGALPSLQPADSPEDWAGFTEIFGRSGRSFQVGRLGAGGRERSIDNVAGIANVCQVQPLVSCPWSDFGEISRVVVSFLTLWASGVR